MGRLARVIAVGVPHHVTQRGNARRFILQDEADRKVYLDLLRQSTELYGVARIGYCLMSLYLSSVLAFAFNTVDLGRSPDSCQSLGFGSADTVNITILAVLHSGYKFILNRIVLIHCRLQVVI